jgi:hypothetical protein
MRIVLHAVADIGDGAVGDFFHRLGLGAVSPVWIRIGF